MIHYIGVYYKLDSGNRKNSSPACVTKMQYIALKLSEIGKGDVQIYSPGYSVEKNAKIYPSDCYQICNKVRVHEATTIGRKNLFFKILGVLLAHTQLLYYLFFNIKKQDIVVLYHSIFYKWDISLFRKVRSNKIIIEVEELFSAAWGKENITSEIKYLSQFDGYIYVNDIMNQKFAFNKPFAVCYGNYIVKHGCRKRADLNKLIYAGVLGQEGSDVDLAIKIMDFLPKHYFLKIAGYGSDEDVDYVRKAIIGKSNISFAGYLSGKEYESFLDDGDLGLCTRVLPNHLSNFTFPSKVLVYLTHGLVPVCPALDCLKMSSLHDSILFYVNNSPRDIAMILENFVSAKPPIKNIMKLDKEMGFNLRSIFDSLQKN